MAEKKRASSALLTSKRRVEKEITIAVPGDGEDGEGEEWTLLFRAIGSAEYDRLITKFPPTADQRREGMSYDVDRFGPTLLSKVCVDPVLTVEDARAIWTSDEWNRGELGALFTAAVEICNRGFDLPPTEGG